jgi:hypothetical protein
VAENERKEIKSLFYSELRGEAAVADYRTNVPGLARCAVSRALRSLFWALPVILAGGLAEANSVVATRQAALGGSSFGLEIRLDDPARSRPNDAWVAIGPDKGLDGETSIRGSFLIDLRNLQLPSRRRGAGRPHLCFLGLSQAEDWATARVILFVERGRRQSWVIGARLWDDGLHRYVTAGRAVLAQPRSRRRTSVVRVDFEWRAATSPGARDGQLRLTRTVKGEPELLFERADLDNAAQTLNYLRAGVVNSAHQRNRTRGKLYLDDFSLSRTYGPVVSED